MKVVVAQINPTVGDLIGNKDKVCRVVSQYPSADLIVFPEMFLSGYPPEDLLFRRDFLRGVERALEDVVSVTENYSFSVFLGLPVKRGDFLYNACVWIKGGKIVDEYYKRLLPNYGVFDEKRYFVEGREVKVWDIDGWGVAPTICEDVWDVNGPVRDLSKRKVDLLVNISASPFHVGKIRERVRILSRASKKARCPVLYVNLVGGQDELVFDGGSVVVNGKDVLFRLPQFQELVDEVSLPIKEPIRFGYSKKEEEVFSALVLGVRDYVNKNGFEKVLIGLSGGVDSSLTAVIAVEALGKDRVVGVSMPSKFNSSSTKEDVARLTKNLGIPCYWVGIDEIFNVFLKCLEPIFKGLPFSTAEENIQARIRGTILMAISNKFGWLVLTTGNKSEMSVGYATLYGDMAGGFGVLKDVPKTMVWRLARYYNRLRSKEVIPWSVIRRPPSAELRYDQKDEDALVPYPLLDKIIDGYVEKGMACSELVAKGLPEEAVKKVLRLIWKAEYKRRQAPPGIKITPLAFGKDWRMPITNAFTPC